MPRLSRFLCPTCGKQLPGDDLDPTRRPACDDCGRVGQWWEKVDSVAVPSPPSIPPVLPLPPAPIVSDRRLVLLLTALGVLLLVVGLVVAAFWHLRSGQERDRIASANQVVAAKIEAARATLPAAISTKR